MQENPAMQIAPQEIIQQSRSFSETARDLVSSTLSTIGDRLSSLRRHRAVIGAVASVAILAACSSTSEAAPAQTTAVEAPASPTGTPSPESTETPNDAITSEPITADMKHKNALEDQYDEEIHALGKLEKAAKVKFDGGMRFFSLPGNGISQEDVAWHIDGINVFETNNLPGLYILEPTGNPNVARYANGEGHEALETYFANLGQQIVERGLDASKMTFAVLPEPKAGSNPNNVEESWAGATPESYPGGVKEFSKLIRKHIPGAKVAALLDINNDGQEYLDQVAKLNDDIDVLVLQAFSNRKAYETNPSQEGGLKANIDGFMSQAKIKAISDTLDPKVEIHINSGIASVDKHVNDDKTVQYNDLQRMAVVKADIELVKELRAKGVNITRFVLFAQNKSKTEGINFAFGDEPVEPARVASLKVVETLVQGMNKLGVAVDGYSAKAA